MSTLALLAPVAFAQQEFRYAARHGARNFGVLTIDDAGVSFQESGKNGKAPQHARAWHWDYPDIQQLTMAPKALTVLTYKDNKWKFGADRHYTFNLASENTFDQAYQVLKTRLDQRFVAAIADAPATVLWEIPVRHSHGFGGDEGILQVGSGEIVFKSARKDQTRTWRYEDVDNISSSGPFQLTITSFERARMHYGSRKGFEFQLKQRLDEARYNDLWLRLNQSKGLKILSSYREDAGAGTAIGGANDR